MLRVFCMYLIVLAALSACTEPGIEVRSDGDAQSLVRVYRIHPADTAKTQYQMLDSINALRAAKDVELLGFDPQLNAAAQVHARDMSRQNRPWHFGSDGSSPIDRLRRFDYAGRLIGENIAETYETELGVLAAWMERPGTRRTILARDGDQMGFAWHQEESGKIWWVLIIADSHAKPLYPQAPPRAILRIPPPTQDFAETE